MCKVLMKEVDLGEPTSFLTMFIWVALNENAKRGKMLWTNTEICLSRGSLQEQKKNYLVHGNLAQTSPHGPMILKVIQRNVRSDIASWRTKHTSNCAKLQLHALMTINSKKKNWDLLENCQKFAHRLFENVCIWRALVDLICLWSVNKFARAITKWTRACDKRLARLISYIQYTCEFKQYCYRPWVGHFVHIWKSYVCSISWMCKKQTSVSLDAGSRMDGITALDLLDLVIEVLHSSSNQPKKSKDNVQGNLPHDTPLRKQTKNQVKTPIQYNDLELCNVDHVSSNVKSSQSGAMLYIFEENEAVIKMIIKGRSPTMRHVSRTHRVALDWLFDRYNLDPKIQIIHVDTEHQLAEILTKGNFTRDEWNNLFHLFRISIFSSASCPEAMSKRMQQGTGEERIVAKSKPTLNLVSRSAASSPTAPSSSASSRPGSEHPSQQGSNLIAQSAGETCRWRFKSK